MKKIFLSSLICVFAVAFAHAQPGDFKPMSVEDRVKIAHLKIDSAFKPDATKLVQVDSVFAAYYRTQDQIRKDLFASGERPDFQVMREKMQPPMDARDTQLKAILTEEQFGIWKKDIEPSLTPRRGGGGGRRS